ncbi:MAG: hypothetical protein Q4C47_05920, partial [Planctomycetia bacterium]|nr:hypothetical protein [Planctomycetia bacterium]
MSGTDTFPHRSSHRGSGIRICRIAGWLSLCLAVLVSGCTTEMVTLRSTPHRPLDEMLNVGRWGGPKPGERTQLFLRMYDLEDTFARDPDAALKQIRDVLRQQLVAEHVCYFAELCYVAGCRVEKQDPDSAAEYFAATTIASCCYLFHPTFVQERNPYDPMFRSACDLYNGSLEKSLRLVSQRRTLLPDRQYDLDFQGERQTISTRLRNSSWKPTQVDHFEFVADYQLEGLQNHHRTYGLGVPLIAVCKLPEERHGPDRCLPPSCCFPVTAFLRPDMSLLPGDGTAGPIIHTLDLYDTSRETYADFAGQSVSLETDFSTVLAWQLSDTDDMKISTLGLLRPDRMLGSLNFPDWNGTIAGFSGETSSESSVGTSTESTADTTVSLRQQLVDPTSGEKTVRVIGRSDSSNQGRIAGLYMVQPYEPGRIPVVMIHGLWSSPMTWIQMFNDLHADPVIRDRYQFWFYLYPTALPYWSSAAL